MADRFPPKVRSKIMASIRGKDTGPEIAVRRILWGHGFRYRIHDRTVLGTPDISNKRRGFAVFVDGCFWHGCPKCYKEPETNRGFWRDKISKNRERRKKVREGLEKQGVRVIEIWEHDTADSEFIMKAIRSGIGL